MLLPGSILAAETTQVDPPHFAPPRWGEEPVVDLSRDRSEIVLNGTWRFMPARGEAEASPAGDWGWIRVPGVWDREEWPVWHLDGPLRIGTSAAWSGLEMLRPNASFPGAVLRGKDGGARIDRVWYERTVTMPESWRGRRVFLLVEHLCTDAEVILDGVSLGRLHWPEGEVELTPALRPGSTHTLRLLVVAVSDERLVTTFMDADRPESRRATLAARGLSGDVVLKSRPPQPILTDLLTRPSFREQRLDVDLELQGVPVATSLAFEAIARTWPDGTELRRWHLNVPVSVSQQTVTLGLPWNDPPLWEPENPRLLTLEARVSNGEMRDSLSTRFGFREFWIDGRHFLLNGRILNLRLPGEGFGTHLGSPEFLSLRLRDMKAANFNIAYLWPEPQALRGTPSFYRYIARSADEVGMLVATGLPEMSTYFDPLATTPDPEKVAAWERDLRRAWKHLRNSPSVIIHLLEGNRFSHGDDQNPRRLGQTVNLPLNPTWWQSRSRANEWFRRVEAIDPARPAASHHSTGVGAFHTSNNYLNLHPLQEREDWLSEWAAKGDVPFAAVEFDPPFSGTLTRGRKGHTGATTTEPLLTEHLATYLGADAYRTEAPAYRAAIPGWHQSGQDYKGVNVARWPAFTDFSAWWVERTWRTWRTWGISGGMWAWENANGFSRGERADERIRGTFTPGSRGPVLGEALARMVHASYNREFFDRNAAGEALLAANRPTLAWIAGHAANEIRNPVGALEPDARAFTEQGHHFNSGETVTKQAALLNDGAEAAGFRIVWTATLEGDASSQIASGSAEGSLTPGQPTFVPLRFTLPGVRIRTSGTIQITATIGAQEHTDTFRFRVHPSFERPIAPANVAVWDPEGDTTRLLNDLGYRTAAWTGGAPSSEIPLLVVGRNAFSSGAQPPGELERFLNAGGRVIVCGQNPDWLREMSSLRLHRHVSRRLWPVTTLRDHPVFSGLDGDDFRDWRGAGSLVPAEAETELVKSESAFPRYGWRWGNRGSVASMMIEKPHLSAWTPLLEGEFDLAYSPLMERRWGKGLLILNGLDLEGRQFLDPAATLVAGRLFDYALTTPLASPGSAEAIYIGSAAGSAFLSSIGIAHSPAGTLPGAPALLIVGPGHAIERRDAERFVRSGGRLLALPLSEEDLLRLGWASRAGTRDGAPEALPAWPELRGLSKSDLRSRTPVAIRQLIAGEGSETAADGSIGRWNSGTGSAVFIQLDPATLDADAKTYLRLTRWRWSRAVAQIATNLGAELERDRDFFSFMPSKDRPLVLGGSGWRLGVETLLPKASKPGEVQDPGNEGHKRGWHSTEFDASVWETIAMPQMLELHSERFRDTSWVVWLRRDFDLPESMAGMHLMLDLGTIDDNDDVYLNGVRIGGHSATEGSGWNLTRSYPVRPGFVRAGKNTLAIRVFNSFGGGGFSAQRADQLVLRLRNPVKRPAPYWPDWRDDHPLGDDPSRYYRW